MRILSICTSAGLWDKVLLERGHEVVPGCEIDAGKRDMYRQYVGGEHWCADIADLPALVRGMHFDAIVGGPPCQSLSTLKAIRDPKFPDLTQDVIDVLQACSWDAFCFENVRPLELPDFLQASARRCNAIQFPEWYRGRVIHQSRQRWFTYRGFEAPLPWYRGSVDDCMAYSVVAGRIYGPKRGAVLQGHPRFPSTVKASCKRQQEALADGVPRGLATAWTGALEAALDPINTEDYRYAS